MTFITGNLENFCSKHFPAMSGNSRSHFVIPGPSPVPCPLTYCHCVTGCVKFSYIPGNDTMAVNMSYGERLLESGTLKRKFFVYLYKFFVGLFFFFFNHRHPHSVRCANILLRSLEFTHMRRKYRENMKAKLISVPFLPYCNESGNKTLTVIRDPHYPGRSSWGNAVNAWKRITILQGSSTITFHSFAMAQN